MGQPTFIQKIDGSNANATSLTLTPGAATTAANMLLVWVLMNANGAQTPASVAGITDSAGDVMAGLVDTGVPINTWSSLGTSTQDGLRIECWMCKGAVSITDLVINLTFAQSIVAVVEEYSAANGITNPILVTLQSNQNTITTNLLHETVSTFPNSGAELMIGFFAALGDAFNATPLEGTVRSTGSLSIPPALSYQLLEQGTVDSTGLLNLNAQSSSLRATQLNVQNSTMQCFFVLISGGLVLNTPPGLSDQPDSTLAAGNFARGMQIAKISGNAALGMCRMEFFQGVYQNGETVNLPVSPVDGYAYQRNELTYVWGIYSSCNPGNGWITGPAALWYCQWNIDQTTGAVLCEEWYRSDGSAAISSDGFLQVFTIAQRQKVSLALAELPTWSEMAAGIFATDLSYSTDLLTALNNNSKFTIVGQECIPMGEFYNGQTVPAPISPADDWAYQYSEVTWLYSWRWTTGQLAYVQLATPPYYNLASLHAAIGSGGLVTCAVGMMGDGGEGYGEQSSLGRIAVFALCQRQPRWTVLATGRPWDNIGGKNSAFPITNGTNPICFGTTPWTITVIPATAGQTYTLKYLSGVIPSNGVVTVGTCGPDGEAGSTDASVGDAGTLYTGSARVAYSGLGCFTDKTGAIVGTPFHFGSGTTSLTVPAGATQIQLGVDNTDGVNVSVNPYSGWVMTISRYVAAIANKFAEISNSLFYPGQVLPAGLGLQVFQNIQEASLSPEFFGPTLYGPGDTIPTPVSTLDGYAYSRSELTYIWEWAEMIPGNYPGSSGDNDRCALFSANVNQSSGLVTDLISRLEPGGPYQSETVNGKISVVVVGFRASQQTAVTVPVTINTPPADAGTTTADSSTNWTVNGV